MKKKQKRKWARNCDIWKQGQGKKSEKGSEGWWWVSGGLEMVGNGMTNWIRYNLELEGMVDDGWVDEKEPGED